MPAQPVPRRRAGAAHVEGPDRATRPLQGEGRAAGRRPMPSHSAMRDLGRRPPQGRVWEWHDGRRVEDRASLDAGPKRPAPSFPRATSRSPMRRRTDPSTRSPTSTSTSQPGEFVSLIGPSGCGKTTLLRVIADLETADGRRDLRERRQPAGGAAEARLWLRVPGPGALSRGAPSRATSSLPLEIMGFSEGRARARIARNLDAREPHRLRAQISVAALRRHAAARLHRPRAVLRSDLLLMDEPFGALDEIVRDKLNEQLLRLWDLTRKTVVFVTHSIPEAVFLSTRIVVMSPRPGPHPGRHRLRLPARPHARHPRDPRVPRHRQPRPPGPARRAFLCRLSGASLRESPVAGRHVSTRSRSSVALALVGRQARSRCSAGLAPAHRRALVPRRGLDERRPAALAFENAGQKSWTTREFVGGHARAGAAASCPPRTRWRRSCGRRWSIPRPPPSAASSTMPASRFRRRCSASCSARRWASCSQC